MMNNGEINLHMVFIYLEKVVAGYLEFFFSLDEMSVSRVYIDIIKNMYDGAIESDEFPLTIGLH